MNLHSVNWLAALVAALTGFVVGGLWYGPLFKKPWMRLTGMTKEKGAQANVPLTFGGAYVLNLIGALGLDTVAGDQHVGALCGALIGALAAASLVATALGVIHLFEQRPLRLWLINAGYQVVNFAAMGAVLGAWAR
ncbi:MAG TPA: DUF1761 domain-containing protein [Steroidobacteraceae bacterium]|nr:DUF1761 domain-containing protein [Steroidobacteraceae bacterium]